MKKEVITKRAISKVLHDYTEQYKNRPWGSIMGFLLPSLGNILIFFVPPLIIGKMVDVFVIEGSISFDSVGVHLGLFVGLWLLGEVFWRIGLHLLILLETEGIKNLAKRAFFWLTGRDYDFYTNHFVGSMTKKALAYSRNFETFTDTLLFNVFTNIFPVIFVFIVLWQYSPWIPVILMICMVVVVCVALPIVKKRSKLVALRHTASSNMVGRLADSISNIFAIKSFAKEKNESKVYSKYVNDFAEKFKGAAMYHNNVFDMVVSPLYILTNAFGLAAAIFFAGRFNLEPGVIFVVFSYYSQITRIFWEINRTYRSFESSINEAAEFTQMFLDPPLIRDIKGAERIQVSKSEISFQNASFRYEKKGEKNSFFRNFNLEIQSNQKVGLVGPSGGGKTTITKLLLRFIELESGGIFIDGQDISKVTQESLREVISYVPQEPLLFHRSLFENISYANKDATEEEVMRAAKLSHADEFIRELPEGYETLVGERGVKLSGGQRQRIAIARAILKNAPILVLDEATSSLDSEAEKYIQEGLEELMKGKTALVIAHRLSTIKNMDRILVLDQGEIVEDGTHEELVRKGGLYAKLWGHQSGEFLQ